MVLKMITKCLKMIPNGPKWCPPQSPSKSPARGQTNENKNIYLMIFDSVYEKGPKKDPFVRLCLMSTGFLTKTIVAVFQRESQRRKSNNDGKHDHGHEKRRP